MKIALLHNHFESDHLEKVKADMARLGAPTIRVLHVIDDIYQALEGSHRLRACEELGTNPIIEEIEDCKTTVADLMLDYDNGNDPEETTIDELGDWENYTIDFDI